MGTYWTEFTNGFMDYAMGAYDSLGDWGYPIIMLGLIGWLYGVTGSLVAAVAGIIVMVGLYGVNVFVDVPDILFILYLITLLTIASLLTALFIKNRRN